MAIHTRPPTLFTACLTLIYLGSFVEATPLEAELHQVRISDNRFEPSDLTIAVGDEVRFSNDGSNAHNVRADDESFRCANVCAAAPDTSDPDYNPTRSYPGNPSSQNWSTTVRFTKAGQVPYYCEAHGQQGQKGMSGIVRIQAGGSGGNTPGALRFSSSSINAAEDSGSASVRVQRSGGTEGAVQVTVSTSAGGTAVAGQDFTPASKVLSWANGDSSTKSMNVGLVNDGAEEGTETVQLGLSNPTGGATLGSPSTAQIRILDDDGSSSPSGEAGVIGFLLEHQGVFESALTATVRVRRDGGNQGAASVQWSAGEGSASAADFTPTTGILTWGDGEDGELSFEVALVADTQDEGSESVLLNLSAPTGGASLGTSESSLYVVDDIPGPCTSTEERLCLNAGRFIVHVNFLTAAGEGGLAHAVELTDDSGFFTFFDPNNVEVVGKVLDVCVAPFDHFWVFAAGLTNVQVALTVVDTQAREIKLYNNDLGQAFQPIQDTAAFATCP